MAKLRTSKPLDKRYGPGYAARRAAKRADRATFRQETQQRLSNANYGLQVIDRAVVGIFEQFVLFKHVQLTLTAVIAGIVSTLTPGTEGKAIAVSAFALSVYVVYSVVRTALRAKKAKEQALLAALEAQQRAGVAPPPQNPQPQEDDHEGHAHA